LNIKVYSAALVLVASTTSVLEVSAQQAPRGSITIDRISDIKYPTDQRWSPDGKTIAFLWDAAGKQNLFMVRAGAQAIALTDFPVNSDTLISDIGHFEWAASDEIILSKDNQLWEVSTVSPKPQPMEGFQGVSSFCLSPDKQTIAFVQMGDIWVASLKAKTRRRLTHMPEGLHASEPSFSPDGKYVAFNAARHEQIAEPLPYNGDLVRVYRSLGWDDRIGVVSVYSYAAEPMWIPISARNYGSTEMKWAVGPSIVHEEFSEDHKTLEIKITALSGETRTLWRDHDAAWISPADGAMDVTSPDGRWLAFISDRSGWPHLYVIPTDATSESQARQLSKGAFGDGYVAWSPDSKQVAYTRSAEGNQMERFIYLAWHPGFYRMYYSMSQYLAQQGYVVLTPDYRGSSGYSRGWATGVSRDLGGSETQDVNAGADYLKTLSYIDPDRIGIWGLSYGGFMTLQSMVTDPTLFRCAIDVAGVGDWETWTTGGMILERLGETPVTDPELYNRSAPVRHLDKLVRPLLLLQGTNDANVPFWESLKVIDTLEKLGKPFDMAIYPGEIHFFRRAYLLRDAWKRTDAFFNSCLMQPDSAVKE
jgi:dipeptidyl aminopeptidase/acylaminoacyl peptidase